MPSTMLTTGEVAAKLGVSRQHVVDLCNAGKLACIRVGSHRRVPRDAVDSMLSDPMSEAKGRSLWLHAAILGELVKDPDATIRKARANLAATRARHTRANVYLDGWEQVLDAGVDEIARTLVSRDEWSSDLRANSPFAGVLGESVRQAVLRSFSRTHQR